MRTGTRPSRRNGKNLVLIVEISLHQAPICRRLLKSFVAFALSRALLRLGIRIAARMTIDRDYNEQLDQGEGASQRGRGTFGHGYWGFYERIILRMGGERKRKGTVKARLLDNGFCIRCM